MFCCGMIVYAFRTDRHMAYMGRARVGDATHGASPVPAQSAEQRVVRRKGARERAAALSRRPHSAQHSAHTSHHKHKYKRKDRGGRDVQTGE